MVDPIPFAENGIRINQIDIRTVYGGQRVNPSGIGPKNRNSCRCWCGAPHHPSGPGYV
jgi:hypothetical protein